MKVSASPYPLKPLDSDRSLVLVKRKLPIATGKRMDHSTDIDRTASRKPTIPAVDPRQMSP